MRCRCVDVPVLNADVPVLNVEVPQSWCGVDTSRVGAGTQGGIAQCSVHQEGGLQSNNAV